MAFRGESARGHGISKFHRNVTETILVVAEKNDSEHNYFQFSFCSIFISQEIKSFWEDGALCHEAEARFPFFCYQKH